MPLFHKSPEEELPEKGEERVRSEITVEELPEQEEEGEKEKNEEAKAPDWFQTEGELALDVYERGENIVVHAPIAGVSAKDITVVLEDDVLTVYGERKNPAVGGEERYVVEECYWGPFSRQVILPHEVDAEKAEATLQKGILTIRAPKRKAKEAQRVQVKKL